MKKCIVSFILGAIIFTGVTGVVAATILAKDISYTPKNTTWNVDNVEDAIDSLYTKANTTITGLNSEISTLQNSNNDLSGQVNTLTSEKSELQSQLNSLTTASTTKQFRVTSEAQTFTVGFQPKYITCLILSSNNDIYTAIYNYDYNNSKIYTTSSSMPLLIEGNLSRFYTINSNGFTFNFTIADTSYKWYNAPIYCVVSR